MEVKISVIIPAYNVAGYIEKCLESILEQTFQEYEVIVVDDGSTDQTSEILDAFAGKDERIHIIHKVNEGVSTARNTAIEMATGKYFLFFDGDDFSEKYTLQELYDTMIAKKVDTVIYGYHRYQDGKIKDTNYPVFQNECYEGERIREELIPRFIGISYERINGWLHYEKDALYVENPALWRIMVSADIIREHHLRFRKELKVGEDTIFISQYLSYAQRCYVLQKCYYYLVIRESSTIYQYELNPLAKLDGKIKLLTARQELTEDVLQRTGMNLEPSWGGTVVMSAVELAFLLSKKHPQHSRKERYALYRKYLAFPEVDRAVRTLQFDFAPTPNMVPFLFLKWRWYGFLFWATGVLNAMHYEFHRS